MGETHACAVTEELNASDAQVHALRCAKYLIIPANTTRGTTARCRSFEWQAEASEQRANTFVTQWAPGLRAIYICMIPSMYINTLRPIMPGHRFPAGLSSRYTVHCQCGFPQANFVLRYRCAFFKITCRSRLIRCVFVNVTKQCTGNTTAWTRTHVHVHQDAALH